MSAPISMERFTPDEYRRVHTFMMKHKAKFRRGSKTIINTTTMKLSALPTIEVKIPGERYMPLDFGGSWYFASSVDRDTVLLALEQEAR